MSLQDERGVWLEAQARRYPFGDDPADPSLRPTMKVNHSNSGARDIMHKEKLTTYVDCLANTQPSGHALVCRGRASSSHDQLAQHGVLQLGRGSKSLTGSIQEPVGFQLEGGERDFS